MNDLPSNVCCMESKQHHIPLALTVSLFPDSDTCKFTQSHSTDHLLMNAFKQHHHIPLALSRLTMPHSVTCKFTQSKLSFNRPLHSVIITVTCYHITTLMTKSWYCWTVCIETTHTCGPIAQKMTSVQFRQYIMESLLDWIQSCVSVLWHCCSASDVADNAALL